MRSSSNWFWLELRLTNKIQHFFIVLNFGIFKARLVELLNNSFLVFKQHYTYFHTLFHPHIFQKTINNITKTSLSNRPIIIYYCIKKGGHKF